MENEGRLAAYQSQVEKALETYLPEEGFYPPEIIESMRYSLLGGGKRLRPVLLLAACEAVGGAVESAEPFAAAIEMIHTYSLVHDDLPAMDDDDYRRGKLTSHRMFGEDMAILTGDALLHQAMEVMAEASVNTPDGRTAGAMLAVARGSGLSGMVAGQVADVLLTGRVLCAEELEFIHAKKTAALLAAALRAGAILGGAEPDVVEVFAKAGEKLGLAFQIQDDILDVTGSQETLGKATQSDEKNHKTTYAALYGIERAQEMADALSKEAMDILGSVSADTGFLAFLCEKLTHRQS